MLVTVQLLNVFFFSYTVLQSRNAL